MTPDRYRSFADLAHTEEEGNDFRIHLADRGTSLAVMAPHGGGIEPGTLEVAHSLAGERYSFYAFDGLRSGSKALHITSTHFDEPRGLEMATSAETILAIHGCKGDDGWIYVGGLDLVFKKRLLGILGDAGYPACETPINMAGNHPQNLCNRGQSGKGIQIEIDKALRGMLFRGLKRRDRAFPTERFDHLVQTLRAGF